jgi:hypothetical protein
MYKLKTPFLRREFYYPLLIFQAMRLMELAQYSYEPAAEASKGQSLHLSG